MKPCTPLTATKSNCRTPPVDHFALAGRTSGVSDGVVGSVLNGSKKGSTQCCQTLRQGLRKRLSGHQLQWPDSSHVAVGLTKLHDVMQRPASGSDASVPCPNVPHMTEVCAPFWRTSCLRNETQCHSEWQLRINEHALRNGCLPSKLSQCQRGHLLQFITGHGKCCHASLISRCRTLSPRLLRSSTLLGHCPLWPGWGRNLLSRTQQ